MPYTLEQWLLDRAHIHDTVTSFGLYTDTQQWDKLLESFPAPKLDLDFSRNFGVEAKDADAGALLGFLKPIFDAGYNVQHIMTSLIIHLPTPGPGIELPLKASVDAMLDLNIIKNSPEGKRHCGGGGRYEFELTRLSGENLNGLVKGEAQVDNPWRVSLMRGYKPVFVVGDESIFRNIGESGK